MNVAKYKKWWMLLILGTMMILPGFSQTDIKDSSQILLSTPIAKLVVKDLIKYDGLQSEIIIKDSIINAKDSSILIKNDMISQHNRIISNLNKTNEDLKSQLRAQQELTKASEIALSKQKKLTYIFGSAGIALGIIFNFLIN